MHCLKMASDQCLSADSLTELTGWSCWRMLLWQDQMRLFSSTCCSSSRHNRELRAGRRHQHHPYWNCTLEYMMAVKKEKKWTWWTPSTLAFCWISILSVVQWTLSAVSLSYSPSTVHMRRDHHAHNACNRTWHTCQMLSHPSTAPAHLFCLASLYLQVIHRHHAKMLLNSQMYKNCL